MKDLENELRSALRRREAPANFADNVLARAAAAPAARARWRQTLGSLFRFARLRWVALAVAACFLVAIGAWQYRRVQQQRAEGEIAKAQLIRALNIASVKLNVARKKVRDLDRRMPQP